MIEKASNRFVFVDTETGGTSPDKHSLLSIGVCIWDLNCGIVDKKEFFVKNENYIVTKHAQKMNGFDITSHELRAIPQKELINLLLDFCKSYFPENTAIPLIGHNIQFDVNFLKKLFEDNGRSFNQYFSHRFIDTYSVFKTFVLAGIIERNLNSSADAFSYFGIKVDGRHSALGDCIATVELYEQLLKTIRI